MDEFAAWTEYKETGSLKTREALILHYAYLVRGAARYFRPRISPCVEYADLVGYGFLGLLDAIDRFDHERGINFEVYARIRISGAISDGIRSERHMPRSIQEKARKLNHAYDVLSAKLSRQPSDDELAEYLEMDIFKLRRLMMEVDNSFVVSLDDMLQSSPIDEGSLNLIETLADENACDPCEISEREDVNMIVRAAVDRLPQKEKIILSLYYFEDLNMREIGEVLHISESRVSKIHSNAVSHLRSYLSPMLYLQPA